MCWSAGPPCELRSVSRKAENCGKSQGDDAATRRIIASRSCHRICKEVLVFLWSSLSYLAACRRPCLLCTESDTRSQPVSESNQFLVSVEFASTVLSLFLISFRLTVTQRSQTLALLKGTAPVEIRLNGSISRQKRRPFWANLRKLKTLQLFRLKEELYFFYTS